MEAGTAEGRINQEGIGNSQDVDSLLESSLAAANEETPKIEESTVTDPEDLEEQEKKVKKTKKPVGRPRIMSTRKPATKATKAHTNGDAKASLAIDESTKKLVRKLRAKMELEDGERVSFSAAVAFAVEKALE
jgi:hypothetical protein